MTQAINFEDLKQAFAPVNDSAVVTPIYKGAAHMSASRELNESIVAEKNMLADQKEQLRSQLQAMEQTYKAALKQVGYLTQEAMKLEQDVVNIHEDKMRLVRSLTHKQHEVEKLKRELNIANSQTNEYKTKLVHSKRDLQKQIEKNNERAKENRAQLTIMKQLTAELTELKQQKTVLFIARKKLTDFFQSATKTLRQQIVRLLPKDKFNFGKQKPLKWQHVSNHLPTKQCTVFVRNGYESDMAVYYPRTKIFKTVNANFNVLEWARAE